MIFKRLAAEDVGASFWVKPSGRAFGAEARMNTQHGPSPDSQTLPSGRDLALAWHLRLPESLEAAFSEQFRESCARLIPGATAMMMVIYLVAFLVEHLIDPATTALAWRPRLLAMMVTGGVFFLARKPEPAYARLLQPAVAAMALTMAGTSIYLGVNIDHPLASIYFYACFLAILMLGSLFRIQLYWALPTSLCILIAMAVALFGLSAFSFAEALVIWSFTLSGTVMSLFGQYFFERLERRLFLSDRVLNLHRSELRAANLSLESQATEDGLTGTVNRRGLDQRLDSLLHKMQHQARGAPDSIAVLLFDIDYFKPFNDTYGHQAGDECLKQIANVPKTMVQRATDFVARYGGEEFVVVLGGTRLRDALVFAERMRARVERLGIPHSGSRIGVVTISVGVACTSAGATSSEHLIKLADQALYEAKGAARNCVSCVEEDGSIRVMTS